MPMYLKQAYKKAGEGLFTRACRDRTRGNGFKLKEGTYRLDRRKILHSEGGEALEQAAQSSCGCPLPGSVQAQVGWGFEQPGILEGVPAHGCSNLFPGWNLTTFSVPSNPNHSMMKKENS